TPRSCRTINSGACAISSRARCKTCLPACRVGLLATLFAMLVTIRSRWSEPAYKMGLQHEHALGKSIHCHDETSRAEYVEQPAAHSGERLYAGWIPRLGPGGRFPGQPSRCFAEP